MRILFLSVHRPGRSPSQRFRFEQFLGDLRSRGHECSHSWLLDADDDRTFYGKAPLQKKAVVGLKSLLKRVREIATGQLFRYDVALVQREAMFMGPPVYEELYARTRGSLILDFDDSIWITGVSEGNRAFAFLKSAGKTDRLIARSRMVFAGNEYLADHARPLNPNTVVVPTTIDTDEYQPAISHDTGKRPIVIGWSGSFSTIQYFKPMVPVLRRLKERHGDRVAFRVIGDGGYAEPSLDLKGLPWKLDTEVADLRGIDIGLMPLPDDEWSRGKCGLKGLQYMALEIPTLMSPVGVNSEIIQDGQNGFLPRDDAQWFERLSALLEDAALRERLGKAGRDTVQQRYSRRAWSDRYEQLLREAAG
jgi:glycosyltransferase involved in cell wall biosynthesis